MITNIMVDTIHRAVMSLLSKLGKQLRIYRAGKKECLLVVVLIIIIKFFLHTAWSDLK